jgi:GH25 family lysozyme M1 (1,4-beta-N-acetylmuramidase)
MAMNGIDVSSWQPTDIGDRVDYDFIVSKATEGTGYVNPNCDAVVQSAIRRDRCFGTYHFATTGDAVAQADYYLNNSAGYIGKGVMVLDYEGAALSQGYAWARAFCQRIIDKTRIAPLLYASAAPMQSYGLTELSDELGVGLWVAAYPNSSLQGYSQPTSPLVGAVMYQYASTGRLDGYGGNLDLDVFYGDARMWAAYAKGTGPAPAPPTPVPPVPPGDINVFYRVRTAEDGWLAEVKGLEDYAGIPGHAITDFAVRTDKGSVWYQAHALGGDWYDKVTGYDTDDPHNGYAGADIPIDLIRCFINSPQADRVIKYRVAPMGHDYYAWQRDIETDRGQDGFAGTLGTAIDRIQMVIDNY